VAVLEPIEWISPGGTATELHVQPGVSGRFAPPVVIQEDEVPGIPGSRFREARHGPREFPLPIFYEAVDEATKRLGLRTLIREMDPVAGTGKLRVYSPVGDQREINCRVVAGLGLDEGTDSAYPGWQKAVAMFRAFDPYWYDTSDTIETFTSGAAASFFPIFPIRLSSSEVFIDATVNNTGDLETWPVWEITGPGSDIRMLDLNTGAVTDLTSGAGTVTVGSGEVVTLDTRPGAKTVTLSDGTNLWPYLSTDSTLWPLAVGPNSVRVEMGGAVTGESSVRLTYRPRYLTP
jgi:phage-related protein